MKLAFDSRPAADERGIGRYARSLLAALQEQSGEHEIVETHDPRRSELYHSPWIEGAMLRCPVPMVVTLHDLIPLKRRGEYLRTGLRFRMRYLAVQRATRIIVPTDVVAADAIDSLGIAPERLAVIPEAAARAFHRRSDSEIAAVRERFDLPDRYLMWVGGLRTPDPRKRIAALARAPRTLPLVLVGPAGPWAQQLPDVQLTGAVDDDELAAIYSGAHALVFPSDDEGFGLPPVEALACGTPVAACDVPALREVVGSRVRLSAVGDLEGLIRSAEALQRPAPDPLSWSWSDAARATWQVYEEALTDSPPAPAGRRRARSRRPSSRPDPSLAADHIPNP
jgi:glycosyltransferase involved in cell wall biosynthesis